jgi:hypothetical protein
MYSINDVLSVAPDRKGVFQGITRVVAVSADASTVALFRLDTSALHAPFCLRSEVLITGLSNGSLIRVDTFEPMLVDSLDRLSPIKRGRLEQVLTLMKPLLHDDNLVLDAEYRAQQFDRHAHVSGVAPRTIRRYFYRYLWGGMTECALAGPQRNNSSSRQELGTARRGPKAANSHSSQVSLPEVREKLERGIIAFFLPGNYSAHEAYVETLKKYFSSGKRAAQSQGTHTLQDILLPMPSLPTFRQFRYVCQLLERSHGKRASPSSDKKQRSPTLHGKARDGVGGPGYRYEIDATRLQVRIVSRYCRRLLLREATLYIVVDVWSGAIVGYAISLEDASWALAAKALRNCFANKAAVFARLGLPYTANDWPAAHLPSRLAADRGEFISNKAGVVPEIGIKLEIMPPMRPDRKGKVESQIKALKHGHRYYKIPGRHGKNPGRREEDGMRGAAFTLYELEQLIVEIIIDLNNDPVPIDNIPAEAVKSGVAAITHGGLFSWGLQYRAGFTRTLPEKEVFTSLMMKGLGRLGRDGIHFKRQDFWCAALQQLGLPDRAATQGAFDIEIRFDEHFADEIWFVDESARQWTPAFNKNEDVNRLKASFWEAEEHFQAAAQLVSEAKLQNIHRRGEKAHHLNRVANQASAEAAMQRKSVTKSQAKSDIRRNTLIERGADRLIMSREAVASFSSAIEAARVPGKPSAGSSEDSEPSITSPDNIAQRSLALWRSRK